MYVHIEVCASSVVTQWLNCVVDNVYTVLLPEIFTRAPTVDSSATENIPQQMLYSSFWEIFDEKHNDQLIKQIV